MLTISSKCLLKQAMAVLASCAGTRPRLPAGPDQPDGLQWDRLEARRHHGASCRPRTGTLASPRPRPLRHQPQPPSTSATSGSCSPTAHSTASCSVICCWNQRHDAPGSKPGDGSFVGTDTASSDGGEASGGAPVDPVPGGLSPARSAAQREAVDDADSPHELIDPGRVVMAASRPGGGEAGAGAAVMAGRVRVRAVRCSGEIAPAFVSEAGVEPIAFPFALSSRLSAERGRGKVLRAISAAVRATRLSGDPASSA